MRPGAGRLLVFAGVWELSNIAQQFWFSGFPWNFWGADWAAPGMLGDIFIQPAAYVSVHGLTLLTVLLAGLPTLRRTGLPVLLAAVVLWAGLGWVRLQTPVPPTGITLALVQPNFPEPPDFSRPALEANWQRLLAMSSAGLNAKANAIIWPEATSPWLLASDTAARAQLATVTGTTPVLAGSLRVVSQTDYRNSLVALAGPVPALAVYDKWKLVPFGEYMPKWIPLKIIPDMLGGGFTPGPGPQTITIDGLPPFGPMICYEDVFPGPMVDEAHRPAWLVVITDDAWFGDSSGTRQHFVNARLRAVEEGLPLARAANSGPSAMIDPYGHVLASLPLDTQGVLAVPLPGHLPPTLFSRLGLKFPLILGVVAIITGMLISALV
jgi:apolipoprotein N-acyltransferase